MTGRITNGSVGGPREARHGEVARVVDGELVVPLVPVVPLLSARSKAGAVVERVGGRAGAGRGGGGLGSIVG